MKINLILISLFLIGCSTLLAPKDLNWEEIALENGHSYDDDIAIISDTHRVPSQIIHKDVLADTCSDQTQKEQDEMDEIIIKFDGKVVDAKDYEASLFGFQNFISDSGITRFFTAKEMIRANNAGAAKSCGYKNLLPAKCRWKSAIAQGLLAVKLRSVINEGKSNKSLSGIKIRNWWRPKCYNSKVRGAKSSDHIQARGFDLDFKSPLERAKAQSYLCSLYKEFSPLNLQVGIGCQTLHVGIGSPKRLGRYPKDGSRFWTYGSIKNCPIKRVKEDDCWKLSSDKKLYIYTEVGSGVL